MSKICSHLILIVLTTLISSSYTDAKEIKVAVASNFKAAIISITNDFENVSGHTVTLSFGSTGKHYAQIKNGAPYDVFLAADSRRPKLLEEEGVAVQNSRFTYAIGKIVLWSPVTDYIDSNDNALRNSEFRFLAIANPRLAPYGKAAKEVLLKLKLYNRLTSKIVRGENINQAFQFVNSGNAELGFVAYSQIITSNQKIPGSYWEVPQKLYTPIEQQAVIIKENEIAREFISYMQSKEAVKIIHEHGYDTP